MYPAVPTEMMTTSLEMLCYFFTAVAAFMSYLFLWRG
jgi:hypothetical protein